MFGKRTCCEMYFFISSSLISEPFDLTTNATGISPAASSFMLKPTPLHISYKYHLIYIYIL